MVASSSGFLGLCAGQSEGTPQGTPGAVAGQDRRRAAGASRPCRRGARAGCRRDPIRCALHRGRGRVILGARRGSADPTRVGAPTERGAVHEQESREQASSLPDGRGGRGRRSLRDHLRGLGQRRRAVGQPTGRAGAHRRGQPGRLSVPLLPGLQGGPERGRRRRLQGPPRGLCQDVRRQGPTPTSANSWPARTSTP